MAHSAEGDARLTRWRAPARGLRRVACVGDSITQGTGGRLATAAGVTRGWVDHLATALDQATGPRPGDGFRGLWRDDEWARAGDWTGVEPTDAFDVAPFGRALYSSGRAIDTLRWTRPAAIRVAAFDLYWFAMPGTGAWQYSVDGGEWVSGAGTATSVDNQLHRLYVGEAVRTSVEIRGYDGSAPVVAPIVGITTYATAPPVANGTLVHNLGCAFDGIGTFCRFSAGDPLALLDDIRPDLVTAEFSNDVMLANPDGFTMRLRTLVERVLEYADVLLIAPFEQVRERGDASMQARYRAVTKQVADAYGCAFLDLYDEWAVCAGAGWEAANAFGLMHDALHPSQAGHDDIAGRVQRTLGLPLPQRTPHDIPQGR